MRWAAIVAATEGVSQDERRQGAPARAIMQRSMPYMSPRLTLLNVLCKVDPLPIVLRQGLWRQATASYLHLLNNMMGPLHKVQRIIEIMQHLCIWMRG